MYILCFYSTFRRLSKKILIYILCDLRVLVHRCCAINLNEGQTTADARGAQTLLNDAPLANMNEAAIFIGPSGFCNI